MMENEQPWMPPEQQKISQMPDMQPQVPELTLFSPSTKPIANNNRPNLMQRAISNEKVFNDPKQKPLQPTLVQNNAVYSKVQPAVPDLSLFDPLVNHSNRPVSTNRPQNMVYQKNHKSSKENIFASSALPAVPDVTILDEEPKRSSPGQTRTNQVFSESYKKLLIKSHEQFLKQMNNEAPREEPSQNSQRKRPGIFSSKFQDNPLRKYAPKPQLTQQLNDGNSSSILIECDDDSPPENEEKTDEMTFKKVAEMLTEIQKLVIPGKSPTFEDQVEEPPKKQSNILRHLASLYLSREELEYYEVEKELNEVEEM